MQSHDAAEKGGVRRDRFPARLALYMILIGVVFEDIVLLTVTHGWREVLEEAGWVESFQLVVLCTSLIAMLLLLFRYRSRRGLYTLFACLLFWEILRELDYLGERQIVPFWPPAWLHQALTVSSLCAIAVAARRTLGQQVQAFLARRAVLLFIIGFLLVTVWGQLLGQRELWRILQCCQAGAGKRLVEEALEGAGYCFVLFGIVEEYLSLIVRASRPSSSQVPAS